MLKHISKRKQRAGANNPSTGCLTAVEAAWHSLVSLLSSILWNTNTVSFSFALKNTTLERYKEVRQNFLHLSAASFLNASIFVSSTTQADWISIFFTQSCLHSWDRALSSYAVVCWRGNKTKFQITPHKLKRRLQEKNNV